MEQTQDQITGFYDAFYRGEGFSYYTPAVTGRVLAALCRRARVPAGSRVLDVGCGTGYYSVAFDALGYDVTGIDISSTAIAQAKARRPDLRFQVQDANALPYEAHSYDLVFALGLSLVNTPDMQKVHTTLRQLLRVTARDGVLALLGGSTLRGGVSPSSNWIHHTWPEVRRFPPPDATVLGGPWLSHFRLMHLLPPSISMSASMTRILRALPLRFERRIILLLKP